MNARGPYAKGVAKRAEILDAALDVIDQHGYSGATVKQLAEAVNLSQNGLLHYFGSKDALFVEILCHQASAVEAQVDPEHADFASNLAQRILDAAETDLMAPGMSQLLLSMATSATDPAHRGHAYIEHRYASFRQVAEGAMRELQNRGKFPEGGDPAAAAQVLAAALDGLQLQWLYNKEIDVLGCLKYLLGALGVPLHSVEG